MIKPKSFEEYLDGVRDLVARYGWMTQGAMAEPPHVPSPFFYTVGLTEKNLPELFTTLPIDVLVARDLLNSAAQLQIGRGKAFNHMEFLDNVIEGFPVMTKQIGQGTTGDHLTVAHRLYGDRVRAVHIVFPDAKGLFPGQLGHQMRDQMWPGFQYVPIIDINQ